MDHTIVVDSDYRMIEVHAYRRDWQLLDRSVRRQEDTVETRGAASNGLLAERGRSIADDHSLRSP